MKSTMTIDHSLTVRFALAITFAAGLFSLLSPAELNAQRRPKPAKPTEPQPVIEISEATTHVTEPVGEDGYIDFTAAINNHFQQGVTPESNAVVLLTKAIGPQPENIDYEFHKLFAAAVGMEQLPEQGDYFIEESRFFRSLITQANPDLTDAAVSDKLYELFDQREAAAGQAWKTGQYPETEKLIAANKIPLQLVELATRLPEYYRPLVLHNRDPAKPMNQLLFSALLPDIQTYRGVARVLAARAMWHLGKGRVEQAQADLLTLHRFARQIMHGSTIIEMLVGVAIDAVAGRGDSVMLLDPQLTAQQARDYRESLLELGPPVTAPQIAESIDAGERLMGLDAVQALARGALDADQLEPLLGNGDQLTRIFRQFAQLGINWNAVLTVINRNYDEIVAATKLPTRAERMLAHEQLSAQLNAEIDTPGWADLLTYLLAGPTKRGEKMGQVLAALLVPAVQQATTAGDRAEMKWQVTIVGLALVEFKAENGRFPATLEQLTPQYVKSVPTDIFSADPLKYETADEGQQMKLYSVGQNETDDKGLGYDDAATQPGADDIVIRTSHYDPPRESDGN